MKHISIPAAALSVLMAASPLAAFANTDSSANGNVEGNVHSSNGSTKENVGDTIRGLFGANPNMKVRVETNASSSEKSGDIHVPKMGITNGTVHAGAEASIDARIANLTRMLARIDATERLSSDIKESMTAAINAQIDALKNAKAEIDAQGTTTVKDEMNSTNHSFRAYALILPKAAITAAADRVMTVASQMEALSVKIDARIDAATDADVSAARTALADFDAKVADAKVQAQAAVHLVADITISKEDDKATFDANVTAFKEAKAKIDAAHADLKVARADIGTILKNIKGKGEVKASASAQ